MELQRTIGHLRQCVGSLRESRRRVRRATDGQRRRSIDIDAHDLSESPPRPTSGRTAERVQVPDTPYDRSRWQGADDEGLGGNPHENT
ncbi:hypothetical protein GS485_10350 [Rhodococcus hoagii]|nr:hypothetical protein [Prescottella equi]